jgi:hypothetical protein
MRYAPSDRFWRNVLLTVALSVCTLGFSVANWNGSGLQLAEHRSKPGLEARSSKAAPAELLAVKSEHSASGNAKLEPLGEAVMPSDATAGTTEAGIPQIAGSAGGRDFTGGRRPSYTRGSSSSSGSGGPGVAGSAGGLGGGVWGTGRSDKKAELVAKSGKPKVSPRSGSKGGSPKGKGDKNKKDKPESEVEEAALVGTPGAYEGSGPSSSPASTPEPLSMILVGTGLAGLYRARKYLS